MTGACDRFSELVAAAAAGRWDALTPADADALAQHVDDCAGCAAALAAAPARVDARLVAAVAAVAPAEWERAWAHIAAAGSASQQRARVARVWRPLAIAAAAALAVGLWNTVRPGEPAGWELRLARGVEVDDLEVFGGGTAAIIDTGGADGFSVIWVMDGSDEGA